MVTFKSQIRIDSKILIQSSIHSLWIESILRSIEFSRAVDQAYCVTQTVPQSVPQTAPQLGK